MRRVLYVGGPFTGYCETAWYRVLDDRLTLCFECDEVLTVRVQHRGVQPTYETFTYTGTNGQNLLKQRGRSLRLIIEGSGNGLVELVA